MDILSIHTVEDKLVGMVNGKMHTIDYLSDNATTNLKRLAMGNTADCVINISVEKGKEMSLVKSDKKYYFAFLNGAFKVFDRKQNRFRKVGYYFEYPKDETAFKELAKDCSFVLGLSRYMIDMYFNCEDVLKD